VPAVVDEPGVSPKEVHAEFEKLLRDRRQWTTEFMGDTLSNREIRSKRTTEAQAVVVAVCGIGCSTSDLQLLPSELRVPHARDRTSSTSVLIEETRF